MVKVGNIFLSVESAELALPGTGPRGRRITEFFPLDLARASHLSHQSEEIHFDNYSLFTSC